LEKILIYFVKHLPLRDFQNEDITMAKKKKQVTKDPNLEVVENVLSRTEQWIEDNQRLLTIIIATIIVVAGGYIGFKKLYIAPMEREAQSQIFSAEQYFQQDSFRLALDGDGNFPGFLEIIDDYGFTKIANLSNYYAGVSYMNLGEYETAIEYLSDYKIKEDVIGPLAIGLIGDAYMELGENEKAIDHYLKAANHNENGFSTPIYLFKAGTTYEILGDFENALAIYERIKKDYKGSSEARDMDKYISRVSIKIKNAS